MLSTQVYLDAFDTDGARLLEVAAGAMDAEVAACPGWDVSQLLVHVGQVYNFIGAGGSRLMCSWDTGIEDVDAFIRDCQELA